MRTVRVQVPATSANLGPGFDSLALALSLHNIIELSEIDEGLAFSIRGEGRDVLPRDVSNFVLKGAQAVFKAAGRAPGGLRVGISSAIPLSSGLGSSAAALLGGVVAANMLVDYPLERDDLLKIGIELEGHPDNVTAALLGGLTLSSYGGDALIYKTVAIEPLDVVVVLPDVELSTGESRAALPADVTLADAAHNVGRTALVVQALVEGDYDLLGKAMQDRLHEPYRKKLIPGYDKVQRAALNAGAAAVAISGAGPSLIAFAPDSHTYIARAMVGAFKDETGKRARSWTLQIDTQGVAISEMATDMPLSRPRKSALGDAAQAEARPRKTGEGALPPAEEDEAPTASPAPETPAASRDPREPARPLGLGEAIERLREKESTSDISDGQADTES